MSATNQFVLIRHATCPHMDNVLFGRVVDPPLDSNGRRQAAALADRLSGRCDLMIEASPRRRARQTAAAIAERLGSPVVIALDIDEIDFGSWSGQGFAQLANDLQWQHWNAHRSRSSTPAGERIAAVQARILRHLARLRETHPGRAIAIVTHAEIIRAALLHWLDASPDAYRNLEISPASLTTVNVGVHGVSIAGINERVDA